MQASINIRHVSLSGCQREAMKGDTKLGRRLKAAIEAKTKEDATAREKQQTTDARLCNDAGINADVVAWYLRDQVGDEILLPSLTCAATRPTKAYKVSVLKKQKQVGKGAGWCLDGFPSTEEEAKLLKDRGIPVSKLIVIDIPDEDLIRLAVGRRIDLESHTIFHRKSHCGLNHLISWCGIAHGVT